MLIYSVDMSQLTTANANRDGTGTLVTVLTPGSRGASVSRVDFQAIGTTTAGMVRLFLYDGSTTKLIREVEVTAITPSDSVKAWTGSATFAPALVLDPTHLLKGSTAKSETFNVLVTSTPL